ncbi:hypothetical protein F4809DRAFT_634753 [Biscogniauxia mediterranea]|nr:hypothetical protein F4809DRAFT_634753 [Biscogniauxia mediterranea]
MGSGGGNRRGAICRDGTTYLPTYLSTHRQQYLDNIYIYIYVCVCVCVCASRNTPSALLDAEVCILLLLLLFLLLLSFRLIQKTKRVLSASSLTRVELGERSFRPALTRYLLLIRNAVFSLYFFPRLALANKHVVSPLM